MYTVPFKPAMPPFEGIMVWNETPAGSVNGTNRAFTLAHHPAGQNLLLSVNGIIMRPGITNDYTVSESTITFTVGATPASGDTLLAFYSY